MMPGSTFDQQLGSAALARDPASSSVRALDALLDERIEVVGTPALLGEVVSVLGRERLGLWDTGDDCLVALARGRASIRS